MWTELQLTFEPQRKYAETTKDVKQSFHITWIVTQSWQIWKAWNKLKNVRTNNAVEARSAAFNEKFHVLNLMFGYQ